LPDDVHPAEVSEAPPGDDSGGAGNSLFFFLVSR
jgi:hypothetical protein